MDEGLRVEQHGPVLVATIDRQERMNALNQEIYDAFAETWARAASDPSLRSIVVTGAGDRAFCTGMDLKDFAQRGGPRPVKADVHEELRVTPLHCDVWLPTVTAVNGVCTGAGLHFISDADIVIASSNASFLDTHVSVGQVAAVEPISLLPRIGLGNTLRLTTLGRHGRLPANEALRIGLVDEVVERDMLLERAIETGRAGGQWFTGGHRSVQAGDPGCSGASDARGVAGRLGDLARPPQPCRQHRGADRLRREAGAQVAVTGSETGQAEDVDAVVAVAEQYFRAQLPDRWVAAVDHDDLDGLLAARRSVDPDEVWAAIAAGGYLVPSWEVEYGGLGVSSATAAAISRTLGRYRMPTFRNPVGVDLVGPALMRWGSEKTKGQSTSRPSPVTRRSGASCSPNLEPVLTWPVWPLERSPTAISGC